MDMFSLSELVSTAVNAKKSITNICCLILSVRQQPNHQDKMLAFNVSAKPQISPNLYMSQPKFTV